MKLWFIYIWLCAIKESFLGNLGNFLPYVILNNESNYMQPSIDFLYSNLFPWVQVAAYSDITVLTSLVFKIDKMNFQVNELRLGLDD